MMNGDDIELFILTPDPHGDNCKARHASPHWLFEISAPSPHFRKIDQNPYGMWSILMFRRLPTPVSFRSGHVSLTGASS